MCENFKPFGAFLKMSTFSFLDYNSKIDKNSKNASNTELSRANYFLKYHV